MKIAEHRHFFVVYVIDQDGARAATVVSSLRNAGYTVHLFAGHDEALAQLNLDPPHFILLNHPFENIYLPELLGKFRDRLPESHFFILAPGEVLPQVWAQAGAEVYDCLATPVIVPQLINSFDHAAERDYFMYLNEKLKADAVSTMAAVSTSEPESQDVYELEEAPQAESDGAIEGSAEPDLMAEAVTKVSSSAIDDEIEEWSNERQNLIDDTELFMQSVLAEVHAHEDAGEASPLIAEVAPRMPPSQFEQWVEEVHAAASIEAVLQSLMDGLIQRVGDVPILYLRHVVSRRCLATTLAHHLPEDRWRGLGVNLQEEQQFRLADLRTPGLIEPLRLMMREVFSCNEFFVSPFNVRGEVHGLFCILRASRDLPQTDLHRMFALAERQASYLDMERYLHTVNHRDPATQLLNRVAFHERLGEEIARARRITLPVSLLILSLDQYREIMGAYGLDEANLVMRAIGKILLPRSRINDLLGRLGPEELGLILPHTSKTGAMIKGERIRRLVEAADFSRLVGRFPRLTVSVGLSEYPTCSRDAEDLFASADSALWQVRESITNKVCAAQSVNESRQDFPVSDR